jgi:hypothetical protein
MSVQDYVSWAWASIVTAIALGVWGCVLAVLWAMFSGRRR